MVADVVTLTFEGSRLYSQTLQITNPGQAPASIQGDLYRRGRNTDPGMDEDGTLVTDWVLICPVGTDVQSNADVVDPATGLVYWVHGVVEQVRSLLRQEVDHIEARLKTVYRFSTTVDILRDEDVTDFNDRGDAVDTGTPPAERQDVPASIVERTQVQPTDTDLRTLASWVGWVPVGTDVRFGDRLRRPDGAMFRVETITSPVLVGLRELRLDLTRTA